MNVLLITENWPPRLGGIEKYLSGMMVHLVDTDIQVHVVAPFSRHPGLDPVSTSAHDESDNDNAGFRLLGRNDNDEKLSLDLDHSDGIRLSTPSSLSSLSLRARPSLFDVTRSSISTQSDPAFDSEAQARREQRRMGQSALSEDRRAESKTRSRGKLGSHPLQTTRKRFFWPFIKPAWLPLYFHIKKLHKSEHIDVLLCGKGLFEGLLGYYCKRRLGIPYVVFTYAMEVEEWKKKSSMKKKLKKVIEHASQIVYINDETKRSLIDLGAKEEQLVKILPCVDDEIASPEPQGVQGRNDRDENTMSKYKIQKPYILSIGRLIPRKGFDDLIQGFSQLNQVKYSDYSLVIVGDGPQKKELEVLAQATLLNDKSGEGRIRLLGYVPDDDLVTLYKKAEAFALTPKHVDGDFEGFGIVYLEASSFGLPIIATSCGGAQEAVINNKTGLVVYEASPKKITQSIEFLISHKDEAKRMGEEGRKRVVEEFVWMNRIAQVKNILNEIIAPLNNSQ